MNKWISVNEKIPSDLKRVRVKTYEGDEHICYLAYLDDIDRYIWIEDSDEKYYTLTYFKYWKEINHKRIKQPMSSIKNNIKKWFTRKQYVLTCITEDLEIYSQDIFSSYKKAYKTMESEYRATIETLGNAVIQNDLFKESATILYDDEPLCFEWKITCIEK